MPFITQIGAQSLTLNGIFYPAPCPKKVQGWVKTLLHEQPEQEELAHFLAEWFNESPTLTVHSSGSTGTPKPMVVEKRRMIASAVATCRFLQLKAQDSALLCMPVRYIAGKMMVVRALVAQLHLISVAPSSHPLATLTTPPTFAAMIPMQVYHSLQQPSEQKLLCQIKQLLIGGGAISTELEAILHEFPEAVWSSYGMTETLSHIALRQLNGPHASQGYKPLPGVTVSSNEAQQLIIHAPAVCNERLVTNDIVSFNETGQFIIRGRSDNTINSGGIKIQIEEVEALLQPALRGDFAITSLPHKVWGDKLLLLTTQSNREEIEALCQQLLPPYWQPKEIITVSSIPRTETGKLSRKEIQQLALCTTQAN
ncbi:MAG: AMP-binding protein [Phocaeicola sp.]